MSEILEFLKSLPLLSEPWFLPVAVGLALVEAAAIVVIKCKTPHWARSNPQVSATSTREIRPMRNGQ